MKQSLPERWITKFIKSATNSRSVTQKANRIIIIIATVILLIGGTYCSILTFEGIKAIPKFKKAKQLLQLSKDLDHDSYEYHSIFGCYPELTLNDFQQLPEISPSLDSVLSQYETTTNPYGGVKVQERTKMRSFNPYTWEELGIQNPSSFDCGLERLAYSIQYGEKMKVWAFPIILLSLICLLIFVWFILKMTYWVVDADKVKE